MSIDVHARKARAERRWSRRGASLPARFQHWLARAWPWAWRVRLDLIVLFHVASWLVFLTLARIIAPELILRTRDYTPDFAVGVGMTISALAALGFGSYWAFSASKSARLREAARYGDQPGILLASFVFLSLAFWIVAAGAIPHVDMVRHPLYGHSIEQAIRARILSAEQISYDGQSPLVALAPRGRHSEQVCAGASSEAAQRDAFLCTLSGAARRADLWRTLASDSAYEEWRAVPNLGALRSASLEDPILSMSVFFATVESMETGYVIEPGYVFANDDEGIVQLALGTDLIRFALQTAPWNARLASIKPWERSADIWEDPAIIAAFARSRQFQSLVDRQFLFGRIDGWRVQAMGRPFPSPEDVEPNQREARQSLMTAAAFQHALAAGEQAFVGAGPPPALFSRAEWAHLSMVRAQMFAGFRAAREAASAAPRSDTTPPPPPLSDTSPTMPLEIWRELEADPAQHAAFVASLHYQEWKLAYLYALIIKGEFGREIRSLPYRGPVETYLRDALMHPAIAPEAVLLQELSQRIAPFGATVLYVALVLALFTVGINQVGIGATSGAVGVGAVLTLVQLLLWFGLSALTLSRDLQQYWRWVGGIVVTLAPLCLVASALLRGRRSRFVGFFAALTVATAAVWMPVLLSEFLSQHLHLASFNDLVRAQIPFWIIVLAVIAFAALVTAMLSRIARLPRAS